MHPHACRFLADFRGTVVAVTHDRYFLDNVAGWILELDRGSGIPFEGNYSGEGGAGAGLGREPRSALRQPYFLVLQCMEGLPGPVQAATQSLPNLRCRIWHNVSTWSALLNPVPAPPPQTG